MRQIHHDSGSERTVSPNLQSEAGFWGARHRQRPVFSRDICDTVRIVGSNMPHIFRTSEEIDGVVNAVTVGLCRLDNDSPNAVHRICDDRGFGKPVTTVVVLTGRGKELFEQLGCSA